MQAALGGADDASRIVVGPEDRRDRETAAGFSLLEPYIASAQKEEVVVPHFGLMDAETLGPEQAALQRARLHLRGGKRRLRQGKISAGVTTLSDALSFAMEWFCASAERRSRVAATAQELLDDRTLYAALVRSAVLSGRFDYERYDRVLDRALENEIPAVDAAGILEGVESVLTELGVLPFDESELPPENPGTF